MKLKITSHRMMIGYVAVNTKETHVFAQGRTFLCQPPLCVSCAYELTGCYLCPSHGAIKGRNDKHAGYCTLHTFDSSLFGFWKFVSLGTVVEELLGRVCRRYVSDTHIPSWDAHPLVYRRLSFTMMRGVAEQFVHRHSAAFGW